MQKKKGQWKFVIIWVLLIMAIIFFYIGRSEKGMLFFTIGCILFVIALLTINWINKKSND